MVKSARPEAGKKPAAKAKPTTKAAVKNAAVKKAAPAARSKPSAKPKAAIPAKKVAPAVKAAKAAAPKVAARKPAAKPAVATPKAPPAPKAAPPAPRPATAPAARPAPPPIVASRPVAPKPVAMAAATPRPPVPPHRPGFREAQAPFVAMRPHLARPAPTKGDTDFKEGDHVVYPTHGVGKVERIATEEIAGHTLELIHITFEENRMTLRVPVSRARSTGLRKLSTRKQFDEALSTLKGRARIKRTMWSRRAQEYEAKINSGDPVAIAEVVRDLHRNAGQPDQSFSERQIYEAAMDRLAAELAAIDQSDKLVAAEKLNNFLKAVVDKAEKAEKAEKAA